MPRGPRFCVVVFWVFMALRPAQAQSVIPNGEYPLEIPPGLLSKPIPPGMTICFCLQQASMAFGDRRKAFREAFNWESVPEDLRQSASQRTSGAPNDLPKWSLHLTRAKITRDFSASDCAQHEGSRDPALWETDEFAPPIHVRAHMSAWQSRTR
jgi:hypothetical protein